MPALAEFACYLQRDIERSVRVDASGYVRWPTPVKVPFTPRQKIFIKKMRQLLRIVDM
jgi:hypothetical protein